jgi:hypothetical protein
MSEAFDPAPTMPQPQFDFGPRNDGTPKGLGFFGPLNGTNGDIVTELAHGVETDGQEIEIPYIVPTLTYDELQWLLSGGEATPEIRDKAWNHAKERWRQGRSQWAEPGELYAPPTPPPPPQPAPLW